jgi:hypothetical protein
MSGIDKNETDAWIVFMMRSVTPCSLSFANEMLALILALAVTNSRDSDTLKVPSIGAFDVDMSALSAVNDY